jgi:4-carboxymuconolactone decarboxylase
MSEETGALSPLPVGAWDSRLAAVAADTKGRPLKVHGLMAHHPALLEAWWPYRSYAVNESTLTRRQREVVILRVAAHLQAPYVWESHVLRGLDSGLGSADIERLHGGASEETWATGDELLVRAVDECVLGHGIALATRRDLAACLSNQQIMDVVILIGMYVTLSLLTNTWGLEPE